MSDTAERERQLEGILISLRGVCEELVRPADDLVCYRELPLPLFGEPGKVGARVWEVLRRGAEQRQLTITGSDEAGTAYLIQVPCGYRVLIRAL